MRTALRRALPLWMPALVLASFDLVLSARDFPPNLSGVSAWGALAVAVLGFALPLSAASTLLLGAAFRLTPPSRWLLPQPESEASEGRQLAARTLTASLVVVLAAGLFLPMARFVMLRSHDPQLGAVSLTLACGCLFVLAALLWPALLRWIQRSAERHRWSPNLLTVLGLGLIPGAVLALGCSSWVGVDRAPWSLVAGLGCWFAACAFWQRPIQFRPLVRLLPLGVGAPLALWLLAFALASTPLRASVVMEKTLFSRWSYSLLHGWAEDRPEETSPEQSLSTPRGSDARPRPQPVSAARRPKLEGPPNLLLITVDALRWDHTSMAGYGRPTTPKLAALARQSLLFERAYAAASTTRFSLPALHTGRPPSALSWRKKGRDLYMKRGADPTLASTLRGAGVKTMAVVNNYNIFLPDFGLDQGFSTYDTSSVRYSSSRLIAGETSIKATDAALALLGETSSQEPWFLWIHYMDPHAPYLQHQDTARYGDGELDRYDSEIAHTDAQVGRLIEALMARPDGQRTIVAVTADHGEQFGERGHKGHGRFVTEEEIRVPLILRVPGLGAKRIPLPVCNSDLTPTLLDLYGLLRADVGFEGRNLLALDQSTAPGSVAPVVVETWPFSDYSSRRLALMQGSAKARLSIRTGHWVFTDLKLDPGEGKSGRVALPAASVREDLRQRLLGWLDAHPLK